MTFDEWLDTTQGRTAIGEVRTGDRWCLRRAWDAALRAQPAAPLVEAVIDAGIAMHNAIDADESIVGFDWLLSDWRKALTDYQRATPAPRPAGVALANALRILLASHDCLAPDGGAEIPEELSAQFDIGLDDARQVVAALAQEGK